MKTMKIWRIMFMMLAALSLASCRPSVQKAETERQASNTEVLANADTLRLVIRGEDSAVSDSVEPVRLKLPLDSIIVEMVNNTDCTYLTGEAYVIEHRVNGKWEVLPIRPREYGTIYAFPSIGYELAAHTSRHFTIHIQPDMYDFEPGKEYRIGKEYSISGQENPKTVYSYFTVNNE